jgi:hypothetical protein
MNPERDNFSARDVTRWRMWHLKLSKIRKSLTYVEILIKKYSGVSYPNMYWYSDKYVTQVFSKTCQGLLCLYHICIILLASDSGVF